MPVHGRMRKHRKKQVIPQEFSQLTAGEQVRVLAETGVTANADWTPYTEEIDGVLMALVPAGCFQMGSTDEQIAYAVELFKEGEMREVSAGDPILVRR